MKTNSIVVERITTDSKLFAHTRWDAIPVAAGLLDFAVQARPRRRRRAPVQIRLLQLLPRGSEDRVPGTEAQRSTGGFLGCPGTHALCGHLCHSWRPQLALHLFPPSVLLLRSQPFLLKRVLSALWRQSG